MYTLNFKWLSKANQLSLPTEKNR